MKAKLFLLILLMSFIFIGCVSKQSQTSSREQSDKIAEDLKYDVANSLIKSIF